LARMEPKTTAPKDQRGCPSASSGGGALCWNFSATQSQAVQKAGKRKPRKIISSKNGAKVTPKAKRYHAAPGCRKILSMGALLGPGITYSLSSASRKQMRAALSSTLYLRIAATPFQCRPLKKPSCHT